MYRNLDPKFPALYSNAFTESTLATNENGLYVGAEIRPATRWKIAAYWDNWNHPWLKFGVQGPSDGNEQMMRLTYTIKRKMEAYIQYRNKSKEENVSSNDPLRSLNHNSKNRIDSILTTNGQSHWRLEIGLRHLISKPAVTLNTMAG